MSVTIKDIAADTGLSLATISKFLNDKPILPENRERIEASIKRLHYIPNSSARSLRSMKSHTIAVIIPTLNNSFWGNILSYFEEECRKSNYSVIFCTHEKNEDPEALLLEMKDKQIDGAVMIPYSQNERQLISELNKHIPCISLDYNITDSRIDAVTSTNYEGGYEAVEYLYKHGHRRIGILAGPRDRFTAAQRTAGAIAAIHDLGATLEPSLIVYADDFNIKEGRKAFQTLMRQSNPPTAIFPVNFDMSLGAIIESSSEGYQIGQDFSIIAFDDDVILSSTNPRITVISQNIKELGRQAAKILLRRISGDMSDYPIDVKIPTSLIERDSVRTLSAKERRY